MVDAACVLVGLIHVVLGESHQIRCREVSRNIIYLFIRIIVATGLLN
jgi:hypothetical protein